MTKSLVIAIAIWAGSARADKAAADAAFAEAKRLVAAGKLAEACPKFEVSYDEDPQVGVLLNLADCHERIGKLATARAEFRSAIELAHQRKDAREKYAADRASKLDSRVAHLVLHARPGVARLQVMLDDRDVTAMLDSDLPIDAGHHVIVATSTGNAPSKSSLDIERDGVRREVTVPDKLAPELQTPPTTARSEPAEPHAEPVQVDTHTDAHDRNVRHLIAGGIAAAGLVTLAVGLGFGAKSYSHWHDAEAACPNNSCDPLMTSEGKTADHDATVSDIAIGVGAGIVAVAAIVWFTAPSEHVVVAPVVGGGTVGGSVSIRF